MMEDYAAQISLQVQTLAAMPLPPSILHWSGLIETPEGVWRTSVPTSQPDAEESRILCAATHNQIPAPIASSRMAKKLRDITELFCGSREVFLCGLVQTARRQTVVKGDATMRFFRNEQ